MKKSTDHAVTNHLRNLGFTDKEAQIYELLLVIGQATAATISNKTGFKRGITYASLATLEEQKLISKKEKDKKTFFSIEHPMQLLTLARQQEEKTQLLSNSLQQMLPQLNSRYKLAVDKPTVRYFEGEAGIREVFDDVYAPKKEGVYGCVDLEEADKTFPKYITETLIPKRIKNKLWAYGVLADSTQAREVQKKDAVSYRKSVLVDKTKYPLPAEIEVYEDKIAMLTFHQSEFIGLIIENADLAQTVKSLFKLIFDLQQKKS